MQPCEQRCVLCRVVRASKNRVSVSKVAPLSQGCVCVPAAARTGANVSAPRRRGGDQPRRVPRQIPVSEKAIASLAFGSARARDPVEYDIIIDYAEFGLCSSAALCIALDFDPAVTVLLTPRR